MGDLVGDASAYAHEDVAHDSDFLTPLHHGVLRYVPGASLSMAVRASLPVKNDRPYVYVPAGYLSREANYVEKILSALQLKLPNLVISTAETYGASEEQIEKCFVVQNPAAHVVAADWTDEHRKEVLEAKVVNLLKCTMEVAVEVGAWVMPMAPRRRNGAAQMVCEALSSGRSSVALGLLGMNEEDEVEGLKQSLKHSMVPLGSPVKTVSSVVYDPKLTDGAPCPQLTHLLVFESEHEKESFREELLGLVPDILLAFGDLTQEGMISVMDQVKAFSPVILLKHTGTSVDSLCRMFKHVSSYMAKVAANTLSTSPNLSGPTPVQSIPEYQAALDPSYGAAQDSEVVSPSAPDADTGVKIVQSKHPKAKTMAIPPMSRDEPDLIRFFVNTWPSGFNPASVVAADPLILSPQSFQKRVLGAITASFDIKLGGEDTRKAKRQAMDYAWSFHDVARKHSAMKKKHAESIQMQLILFTLSSVVISILYDRYYQGSHPTGGPQLFFFVATILLPLYITSLKQVMDTNPVHRWGTFEMAVGELESEIFKFRSQVGPYRAADKTERAMQEPLQHFSERARHIWGTVKEHLKDDGMYIPDDFWESGSPRQEEALKGQVADDNKPGAKKIGLGGALAFLSKSKPKETLDETSKGLEKNATESNPLAALGISLPSAKMTGDDVKDIESGSSETATGVVGSASFDLLGAEASEITPMLKKAAIPVHKKEVVTITRQSESEGEKDDEEDSDDEDGGFVDDHYSALKADQYIECRMKKLVREKVDEVQKMVEANEKINLASKLVTMFSGATAALSMQWLVPIVLGVTAALGSGQEFRKYTRRIEHGNAMLMQLNEMKLWWMGLSMYQKQLPHNKDRLIQESERIILADLAAKFDASSPKAE